MAPPETDVPIWKEGHMRVAITVPELAEQMGKSEVQLYSWAKRENDPLPLRYVSCERYGSVLVSEFEEWFKRNGVLMRDRSKGERSKSGAE